MGDDNDMGFDDQFNDGLFSTTLHNCKRERPDMWPKSVSEMRGSTEYGQQGMGRGNPRDTAHSDQMMHRSAMQQDPRAENFRYGRTYGAAGAIHEGFRHGRTYGAAGALHEGLLPLRKFYDSGKGRWVWVDRAGNEVHAQAGRKEGLLPLRKFYDSGKGRWVWVDRAGNEVHAQAGHKEGLAALRQFYDSGKGRWVWIDRAGNEVGGVAATR